LIENKTLTVSILEHLRGQIITSNLKSGQRINENQLATELNVSRPPLREAFQVLEQEHFIVCVPRKGRYVSEITTQNYEKIHEVRSMIECHVIDLLKEKNLRNLPMVDLAIEDILNNPMPPDDPYEKWHYLEAIDEFHVKLVDSAKNMILNRFYGTIRFNIYRYQYWLRVLCMPDLFSPKALQTITGEHREILDSIQRGDFDGAKDCLKSHMEGTWKLMKTNL
jgi:DNA-binding GntR family transcriptional regulator